jgi:hypothetical protein
MKKFKFLLFALLSITILACGGNDDGPEPTPEELRLIDIAGTGNGITWSAASVTFEGSPSSDFDGMTLTLRTASAGETYSSTNGDPVFSSSGTFALNPSNLNQITIDGISNNIFNITNLNADATPATMTLTVNFTDPGGTIEGINGTYVFNLQHN